MYTCDGKYAASTHGYRRGFSRALITSSQSDQPLRVVTGWVNSSSLWRSLCSLLDIGFPNPGGLTRVTAGQSLISLGCRGNYVWAVWCIDHQLGLASPLMT